MSGHGKNRGSMGAHGGAAIEQRLALVAALLGAVWLLHMGGRALPAPPPHPVGVTEWATANDPATLLLTFARLMLLVLVGYTLVIVVGLWIAEALGRSHARRVLWALLVPPVRHLVRAGGLGVAVSIATAVVAPVGPTGAPTTHQVLLTATDPGGATPAATPQRHLLVVDDAGTEPTSHSLLAVTTAVPAEVAAWVIQPGEHLWHVAEQTLIDAGLDHDVTAVASYHQRLIAANVDRLVVPGEPDLVFAGQEILRPDPR